MVEFDRAAEDAEGAMNASVPTAGILWGVEATDGLAVHLNLGNGTVKIR
ncbi:MAG: hypothetical protein WD688_17710 [Candidatus Binatia bacterium]